jgi:hypothetical protein
MFWPVNGGFRPVENCQVADLVSQCLVCWLRRFVRLVVPIRPLLKDGYFTPEDVTVLIEVFEQALQDLRLADRNDPAVELVAKRIIALARPSQCNPKLLREAVLKSFKNDPGVSGL